MHTNPLCMVGDPEDLTAVYVGWRARQRGLEVLELREDRLGLDWGFDYDDAWPDRGWLEIGERGYNFADFAGAFVRFHPEPEVPDELGLDADTRAAFVFERRLSIQHLVNSLPCTVANRPAAGRSNGAKPLHMRELADTGFVVPRWIVTNEPDTARVFAKSCECGTIYKSCTGLRSEVRMLDDRVMQRLAQGSTPIILQEYVVGRDVRVHSVGPLSFATEVISEGIDYRFSGGDKRYLAATVPPAIEKLCCEIARSEGLVVAGFDFRVTHDDCWYCLEMNPVPTFLPYEMETRQPIAEAILEQMLPACPRDIGTIGPGPIRPGVESGG